MPDLYPYQHEGAAFLADRKRALLADDMGLGKTLQAIAACDELLAKTVVVVCPASVRENWRREFARFSYTGAVPAVYSYAKLPEIELCDVLILDEAHFLKGKDAKRTQAVFGRKCDGAGGLVDRADRVFLLTGTPMPNHPAELWPMLRACAPDTIVSSSGKPYAYWPFVTKYCVTKDNGFGLQIVRGKNHDKLREVLAPFMLRRTKEEVLPDLPEIRYDELFVEGDLTLNQEARDQTWAVQKALSDKGVDGLREIAPHVATLRRLTGLAKVKPVIEWVRDWLDAGGGKIVLFAHHREVIDGLRNGFGDHACVTGDVSSAVRQSMVDRFQNDPGCPVFIGQITAAGTGITLTAASDLIFVEQDWTPANNSQAAARIHRITQKSACLVRVATLAGSIDERISKALLRKMADIEKVMG